MNLRKLGEFALHLVLVQSTFDLPLGSGGLIRVTEPALPSAKAAKPNANPTLVVAGFELAS